MAPKSQGVCYATYSGDLAPAFLVLGAEVELAGPQGRRWAPLCELYRWFCDRRRRAREVRHGDGKTFLALRPLEFIVRVRAPLLDAQGVPLRTGFDKFSVRRAIEYPVASVAVALRRDGERLDGVARRLHRA